MKTSWKTGISFGLTSGVITTLGLMVGLHSGTHSRAIVIGGILTIAIADAMSDALGIHESEESKNSVPVSQVWEATLATFAAKFVVSATFVVPVVISPLDQAIVISIVWGTILAHSPEFLHRTGADHCALEGDWRTSPHRPVCHSDDACGRRLGERLRGREMKGRLR